MSRAQIHKEEITGLILAGGRSQRMGEDKAWVKINDKPMLIKAIENLEPYVSRLIVSANSDDLRYQQIGYELVQDEMEGFQGPLSGLLAGLKKVETQWVAVLPCDTPYLSENWLKKLIDHIDDNDLAVFNDGERLQTLCLLLKTNLKESLQNFLDAGDRKTELWVRQQKMSEVDSSDCKEQFKNINTPAELI